MYHQHQGPSELFSTRTSFPMEQHLFLRGGNTQGDSGLVLSTDAKPRLKWTPELHQRFVDAVNQLGGAESKYAILIFSRYRLQRPAEFLYFSSSPRSYSKNSHEAHGHSRTHLVPSEKSSPGTWESDILLLKMISVPVKVIIIFPVLQKYRLSKNLQAQANVSTSKNGKNKLWLPFPSFCLRSSIRVSYLLLICRYRMYSHCW